MLTTIGPAFLAVNTIAASDSAKDLASGDSRLVPNNEDALSSVPLAVPPLCDTGAKNALDEHGPVGAAGHLGELP